MAEFERQGNSVWRRFVEDRAVAPAEVGAVGLSAVNQKVEKSADARLAGEQDLAGGAAPHGGQLIHPLPDPHTDVLAALVPAAPAAHDLAPRAQPAALPSRRGAPHGGIAARMR